METPSLPDSTPPGGAGAPGVRDVPRTGLLLWGVLLCFFLPPALVALATDIPYKTVWVILLGCPLPLILLSLPRCYRIDKEFLTISGYLYRLRVPLAEISTIEPIGALRAMLHPGSLFCSDPRRALKLTRKKGRPLVISPTEPEPFLSLVRPGRAGGG